MITLPWPLPSKGGECFANEDIIQKRRNRITRQVVEGFCLVKKLYAHSANPKGQRHILSDHLKAVASLSRKFVDKYGAGDLIYWACLWRDMGKYSFFVYIN